MGHHYTCRVSRKSCLLPPAVVLGFVCVQLTATFNRSLAEDGPLECGKVPIFERTLQRSINESFDADPDRGDVRILHGLDALKGEWPWIARIAECNENDDCDICTGTLLNNRWIISAGHCAYNKSDISKFRVDLGLYDIVNPDEDSKTIKLDKIVVHPQYRDLNNDLALFRLAEEVAFGDNINRACLVPPIENAVAYSGRRQCYNVGYGLTAGMSDAERLQKLEIKVKEPSECNSDTLNAVALRANTLCVGPPPGKIGGSCRGDSGGPDLCYEPKGDRWVLVGTVSYGPADCDRETGDKWLTVSTDISSFRTWIEETMAAN